MYNKRLCFWKPVLFTATIWSFVACVITPTATESLAGKQEQRTETNSHQVVATLVTCGCRWSLCRRYILEQFLHTNSAHSAKPADSGHEHTTTTTLQTRLAKLRKRTPLLCDSHILSPAYVQTCRTAHSSCTEVKAMSEATAANAHLLPRQRASDDERDVHAISPHERLKLRIRRISKYATTIRTIRHCGIFPTLTLYTLSISPPCAIVAWCCTLRLCLRAGAHFSQSEHL